MRTFFSLVALAAFFMGCHNVKQPVDQPKKETPKALQDDKGDVRSSLFYKRGSNDLLNELYQGLVNENQNLKDIEKLLEGNNTEKIDILDKYSVFDSKNESYYTSAHSQCMEIKDSVLRKKILSVIKLSSDQYKDRTSHLTAMIRNIESKNISIQDYHTAMKVMVTMPLIENYQHENLPKDSIYKGFSKQQDMIINKMDKIIKK